MTTSHTQDLSTTAFTCVFRDGLALEQFGLPDLPWALPSSGVFAAVVDGRHITGQSAGLSVRDVTIRHDRPGRKHRIVTLLYDTLGLVIEQHTIVYDGMALAEAWLTVKNTGEETRRVTRLDSLVLKLPPDTYELLSFTGAWGSEFEPQRSALAGNIILESRSGRSSFGNHPWFALTRGGTSIFSGAVAWSGNWVVRLEQRGDGGYTLSGGLHDWEFASDLGPGEAIEAPPVVLALAKGTDLNQISTQYAAVGRRFWYPHNRLSDTLPVEWNHWWSYEDKLITEQVFRANVDVAARLGMEVCALDAGWFGPTDPATHWYDYRGDWDMVNAERFPSGIRALSDYVHSQGMAFGLWCEIEGLGVRARLAETHPELVARRDGERLGYVCLGSEAGRAWAFATLDRLIGEYDCDWVKLDFNLDPGAGCNRTDHGHGAGDGLYAHYQGYYQLLERVRERYPEVVLENCSSGGLRIDLGIARQTHMAFLSDPDWPEHSLQLFWGASAMLAPDACLHWGYCEWTFAEHRHQHFDARDPGLHPHQLDYYTRISMLRRFGFSQKLPDLPGWVADRYREHIADYKAHVRRFLGHADLHRLTEQPLRDGRGERWAAFQYRQPGGSEHLLAVFRLHGGEEQRSIRLVGLEPDRLYSIAWLGDERKQQASGAELMQQGLLFTDLLEEDSALMLVR